jgi:hypothetical protein
LGHPDDAVKTLDNMLVHHPNEICPSFQRCLQKYNKHSQTTAEHDENMNDLEEIHLRDSDGDDDGSCANNTDASDVNNSDDEAERCLKHTLDHNDLNKHVIPNLSNKTFELNKDIHFVSKTEFKEANDYLKNLKKKFNDSTGDVGDSVRGRSDDQNGHCINQHALDSLEKKMKALTDDQQKAFKIITAHLSGHEIARRDPDLSRDKSSHRNHTISHDTQLRMVLSGEGGVGKTYLIETVVLWAKLFYGKSKSLHGPTLLTAPTGKAAALIKGRTLFSTFFTSLTKGKIATDALRKLQKNMKGVKLLILDEMSMVGIKQVGKLNAILQRCFNTTLPFGGIHIMLAGDFYQLPPVKEDPMYYRIPAPKARKTAGFLRNKFAELGEEVYETIDTFVELTTQKRMASNDDDNREFKAHLRDMRIGTANENMVDFLNNQIYPSTLHPKIAGLKPNQTLFVAPTNATTDLMNKQKTEELVRNGQRCVHVWAQNVNVGGSKRTNRNANTLENKKNWASIRPSSQKPFMKLQPVLDLCVGSRVMTNKNLATELGVVNGSFGTVVGFLCSEPQANVTVPHPHVQFPNYETVEEAIQHCPPIPIVLIQFDDLPKDTPSYYKNKKNVIPIGPSTANLLAGVQRHQVPLELAWCTTIHKAQGSTVDNVVCLLEPFHARGLLYVASSRVRNVKGLHFVQTWKKNCLEATDITTKNTPTQKKKDSRGLGCEENADTSHAGVEKEYIRLRDAPLTRADTMFQDLEERHWDPISVFMDDTQFEIESWSFGLQESELQEPETSLPLSAHPASFGNITDTWFDFTEYDEVKKAVGNSIEVTNGFGTCLFGSSSAQQTSEDGKTWMHNTKVMTRIDTDTMQRIGILGGVRNIAQNCFYIQKRNDYKTAIQRHVDLDEAIVLTITRKDQSHHVVNQNEWYTLENKDKIALETSCTSVLESIVEYIFLITFPGVDDHDCPDYPPKQTHFETKQTKQQTHTYNTSRHIPTLEKNHPPVPRQQTKQQTHKYNTSRHIPTLKSVPLNHPPVPRQQTLHDALCNLPTQQNSGMDSNESTLACGFLSIYGLTTTRFDSAWRLCRAFGPFWTILVKQLAQTSIINYFTEIPPHQNSTSFPYWTSYNMRKANHHAQIALSRTNIVNIMAPLWSDADRGVYPEGHPLAGQRKLDIDVQSDIPSIVQQNSDTHPHLAHIADEYFNLLKQPNHLFPETEPLACQESYFEMICTDGYQLSDEDLHIIAILEDMTIIRINRPDASNIASVEPIHVCKPDHVGVSQPTDTVFIAYYHRHYERIITRELAPHHKQELAHVILHAVQVQCRGII